jgi:hypothetical protein
MHMHAKMPSPAYLEYLSALPRQAEHPMTRVVVAEFAVLLLTD